MAGEDIERLRLADLLPGALVEIDAVAHVPT
jgi:hypothetical protein